MEIFILLSIIGIIGIIILFKQNKDLKEKYNLLSQNKIQDLSEESTKLRNEIQYLSNEIKEKQNFNSSLKRIREEELDRLLAEQKEFKENQIEEEICEWTESAQEAATAQIEHLKSVMRQEIESKKIDLSELKTLIEEYKAQRDVINEEILRSRAMESQQDFYRVQFDVETLGDIEILNSMRPRLQKFELFNKFLYSNYISKPTKEMVKRVLAGRNPSGIYKVTNIDTKEIYIGKSVTVATRFENHIKSAYGLEGVADSQFQRALKKYGVDHFTWELLEEVPKDKLGEKEKYWIQFYGTKEYGYNMKEGG